MDDVDWLRNGRQWTEEELVEMRARPMPPITIGKILPNFRPTGLWPKHISMLTPEHHEAQRQLNARVRDALAGMSDSDIAYLTGQQGARPLGEEDMDKLNIHNTLSESEQVEVNKRVAHIKSVLSSLNAPREAVIELHVRNSFSPVEWMVWLKNKDNLHE